MKQRYPALLIVLLCLLLPLFPVQAMEVAIPETTSSTMAPTEEEKSDAALIPKLYFQSGNEVKVDKAIDGTAFLSGRTVTYDKHIRGDLFAAAETVIIRGTVDGNLYVAANQVKIFGKVKGDVFVAGGQVQVANGAEIERDFSVAAASVAQLGHIGRDMHIGSGQANIQGTVDRDVSANVSKLSLAKNAEIGGDLKYQSPQKAVIAEGAMVKGDKIYTESKDETTTFENQNWGHYALSVAKTFLGLMILFLLWRALAKDSMRHLNERFFERPLRALLFGLLTLFFLLPIIVLLLISQIGMPLAVLLSMALAASLMMAYISLAILVSGLLAHLLKKPALVTNIPLNLLLLFLIVAFTALPLPHPGLFQGTVTILGIWIGWSYLLAAFQRKKRPLPEPFSAE